MTVDVLSPKPPRTRTRRSKRPDPDALVIGERDANIFDCPSCARPLGSNTTRCPGCGTRIIARVQATRAVGFMLVGAVAGVVIAAMLVAMASIVFHPPVVASAGDTPLAAASAGAPATVLPSAAAPSIPPLPVDPGVPPAALSALRQSAILNQRIAADTDRLSAALAVAAPSANDIARALRALAGDATFGARIVPEVAGWDDATGVAAQLDTLYAAIAASAKDGLAVSLQSTAAYVRAGHDMVAVVAQLDDVDASSRELAHTAGAELPPVTLPTAP